MEIPKIIHYCWFGPKEIPSSEQIFINGWKQLCPDFSIKKWSEENFNIDKAPLYVQQAYKAHKYAFVSDYVRMLKLFEVGGIYFDTDVEIIGDITPFLSNKMFIGFENRTMLGTGVIGAVAKHPLLSEMLQYYETHPFIDAKGLPDTTTNVQILVSLLERHGFIKANSEQYIHDIHIYERDYFNPKKVSENKFRTTSRTITIHHMAGSWLTERERLRGTNKIWRNICRPILKKARAILTTALGKERTKQIEIRIRAWIR